MTDRPTRSRRLEYERLPKMAHKINKNNKRIPTDKRIQKIEENIKENYIRNTYKEVSSLKGGFKPHKNLCIGTNNDIISDDEDTEQQLENDPPDILDIELAMQSMINKKTPGRNNYKKG